MLRNYQFIQLLGNNYFTVERNKVVKDLIRGLFLAWICTNQ